MTAITRVRLISGEGSVTTQNPIAVNDSAILRSADNQSRIKLFARPFGEVFQMKHQSAVSNRGSSSIQHKYEEPEVFTEKTDIVLVADVDANSTEVSGGFDIVLKDNDD